MQDLGVYEIVDGQQRITTLILLLKAIEQYLIDERIKRDISEILVKDDGHILLLQTNTINQQIFNNYLRNGKKPQPDNIKTHADENINSAIQDIEEFLEDWKKENRTLEELLTLIRNRIGFVVYDTEEKHAVYTLFECLNSRGLVVDWLDKTKSILMGLAFEKSENVEIANSLILELQGIWANIYEELAKHPVQGHEILRITATLYVGTGAGRPLSSEESIYNLREYCKNEAIKTITVSGWLLNIAKKLVELNQKRYWASVTKILQVRVLAIAIMLTDTIDEKDDKQRKIILDQWERVSFRIYGMFGKDSRTKVGDYIRLAFNIIQKKEGMTNFSDIMNGLYALGGKEFPIDKAVSVLPKSCK